MQIKVINVIFFYMDKCVEFLPGEKRLVKALRVMGTESSKGEDACEGCGERAGSGARA